LRRTSARHRFVEPGRHALTAWPGTAAQPARPILPIESKGADRSAGAEDDGLIGGLSANLSDGSCRFVMVKYKR
jgi:type III restriction enzyme